MPSRFSATYQEAFCIDTSRNRKRFYRTWVVSTATGESWVIFNWGRIGANGQFGPPSWFPTVEKAEAFARQKLNAKLASGYSGEHTRTLPVCPADLLAHIDVADAADGVAAPSVAVAATDLIGALMADIDTCRRLAMGDNRSLSQAIVMRRSLSEQLDGLRRQVLEAEGATEMIDVLLVAKFDA